MITFPSSITPVNNLVALIIVLVQQDITALPCHVKMQQISSTKNTGMDMQNLMFHGVLHGLIG